MELSQKLQQLRKQKGYTQEDLAKKLFVSRTAISKWESGRGYPSIESLKAIAKVFDVTVDFFLSGEEMMAVFTEDKKQTLFQNRSILYGLMDLMSIGYFFIPLFGKRVGDYIYSVTLLRYQSQSDVIVIIYFLFLIMMCLFGIIEITFQNQKSLLWQKMQILISLSLSILTVLLFIITLQPYIAFFQFSFLLVKGILLWKQTNQIRR